MSCFAVAVAAAAVVGLVISPLLPSAFGAAADIPVIAPEVPVTAVNVGFSQRSQNSPVLGVDPTDRRFVVVASRSDGPTEFDCDLSVSGDRGRSWLPAHPVPVLPEGAERCYAPEVAFDRDGVLHYLFVGLQGEGNRPMGAFLTSSFDRAQTWSVPKQVLGPGNFMVRMALDPEVGQAGRIHVVWVQPETAPALGGFTASPNAILSAHSDDQGATFSVPVRVSDPARQRVVGPTIVVGGDHRVHVAYYDLRDDARDYQGLEGPASDGPWSLVVASSDDGGGSFSRQVAVDDAVVPAGRVSLILTTPGPAFAVDGSKLYLSWADARSSDWDVLLARSADAGGTWSTSQRLNDDDPDGGQHQYLPRLSVSPGGRVDAIFYDRRDDPENVRNHVYGTSSSDGGRLFSANFRVTSESFRSDIGTRYPIPSAKGLVEFGSRIALWSEPEGALAAWTDTRTVPSNHAHQDIFATEFVMAPQANGLGRWSAFGLVGASSALLLAVVLVKRRRRNRGHTDRWIR